MRRPTTSAGLVNLRHHGSPDDATPHYHLRTPSASSARLWVDLVPVQGVRSADLKRSLDLFRAFRVEKADPDRFYRLLAEDSVRQVAQYQGLEGTLVLDVGGGAGYFTNAFRESGARCVLIEPQMGELKAGTPSAVVGNGYHLPFADATADICFSSNVLEHVPDPRAFIMEMTRVTRPGGTVYVAYTNWLSPWGGHGTAPWHYLGGEWALNRYKRVNGREPINRYGETLFATHIGPILKWVHSLPEVDVIQASPRYYPDWCNWIVRVPGLREVATWNLMLILRRRIQE